MEGVYTAAKKRLTVSQTIRTEEGFELQEDGRLQMMLLGATTAAALRTTARVDQNFALQSFEFSLDPGTGAVQVSGAIAAATRPGGPHRLTLWITSGGATRAEQRDLAEPPVLSQNLSRVLANGGLRAGKRHKFTILDPATLRNVPITLEVGRRELVRVADTDVVPAFRVNMEYEGLQTTSWMTDTGDVLKEESPLGLVSVRESPERARGLAVPMRVQTDLLRAAAVVPGMAPHLARRRIDEPRDVKRMRVQLTGVTLPALDLDGVGQIYRGDSVELIDRLTLVAGPADAGASRYLAPETLIESDDPTIIAEANKAVAGVQGPRARAERLTRYVNGLLDKKPTVSLPSAREVLRTKVGDCNEHTALFARWRGQSAFPGALPSAWLRPRRSGASLPRFLSPTG